MEDIFLQDKAERVASKIKHYLITTRGITLEEAGDKEFFQAFALTLREEIMINWTATTQTFHKKKARMLYYLCMEYMPGRMLATNIESMHASDLVNLVLKKMNRDKARIFQIEQDPGLGNGGLGRLASCFMDSLATQQYPAQAYGLRYQYGIFEQQIQNGLQIERPDTWLINPNVWEFRRDEQAVSVNFAGRLVGSSSTQTSLNYDLVDCEEVRALAYDIPMLGYKEKEDFSVLTMRLWTTKESPRNFQLQRFNAGMLDQASENTLLTDVLYASDNNEVGKRIRLKQEFLLASASIQDIINTHLKHFQNMDSFIDKVRIQINDTHPALVIAELMRLLIKNHNFSWNKAWDVVQACCSYTNHTVLKESLEEWNQNRLQYLLPAQYNIIERLNLDFCTQVRAKFPSDEEKVRRMSIIEGGQVRMANLAIYGSHRVNGVSALHSEILKKSVFSDFADMFPERFINVTNGVTQRRFLLHANPLLSEFITRRIGKEWITNFVEIKKIANFANDAESQQEFLEIKKANKRALIAYLSQKNPLRDDKGNITGYTPVLGEEALFDVQIKRIHEYKRQLMNALHLIMLYHELKKDPASRSIKRMVLFAGKAAPAYDMAKNIIQLISCIARKINNDPIVSQKLKVCFFENYNVSGAELIIPAADLSQQISTAGTEASGTGNMKLAMNGALTIGTEDGANIEMRQSVGDAYWPFRFGATAEEIKGAKGTYNPMDIYIGNPLVREAMDSLRDRTFAQDDKEHEVFSKIYRHILEKTGGDQADKYFVLKDLESYVQMQKKVEELYQTPNKWAEMAIANIAGMGNLSSDESIHNYAKLAWDLEPCLIDQECLNTVREQYRDHDRCRILGR